MFTMTAALVGGTPRLKVSLPLSAPKASRPLIRGKKILPVSWPASGVLSVILVLLWHGVKLVRLSPPP